MDITSYLLGKNSAGDGGTITGSNTSNDSFIYMPNIVTFLIMEAEFNVIDWETYTP